MNSDLAAFIIGMLLAGGITCLGMYELAQHQVVWSAFGQHDETDTVAGGKSDLEHAP